MRKSKKIRKSSKRRRNMNSGTVMRWYSRVDSPRRQRSADSCPDGADRGVPCTAAEVAASPPSYNHTHHIISHLTSQLTG